MRDTGREWAAQAFFCKIPVIGAKFVCCLG